MRRPLLAALALCVGLAAPAAALGAETSGHAFRLPSRNIGCTYAFGTLRCDILSGLVPEPARACRLDWTGLSLAPRGRARPVCAGDTAYPHRAPVLAYGRSWRRAGIVCASRRTGLRCVNREGRGFTLARRSWRTF